MNSDDGKWKKIWKDFWYDKGNMGEEMRVIIKPTHEHAPLFEAFWIQLIGLVTLIGLLISFPPSFRQSIEWFLFLAYNGFVGLFLLNKVNAFYESVI